MQRAEYIWFDGQEGDPKKGLLFNEMRSKTKVKAPLAPIDLSHANRSVMCSPGFGLEQVIGDPIPLGGNFPDWNYDGSSTDQVT